MATFLKRSNFSGNFEQLLDRTSQVLLFVTHFIMKSILISLYQGILEVIFYSNFSSTIVLLIVYFILPSLVDLCINS